MTREEFDQKWAGVPSEHTSECGVMLGTCECTCGHQARRRERQLDEISIGREERAATEEARIRSWRRRAQQKSILRNLTGLVCLGALASVGHGGLGISIDLLTIWVGVKTFGWWACAYGMLPSNWLDPGDATRGFRGWAKSMVVGIH